MELDVLVFGSSNIDYIMYVNELPKTGETVFAMHRERCYGGKGANQCVAAAKLGANCALISKLGDDELGVKYLEYLTKLGINVEHVGIVAGQSTGLTEINVADNAQNMNIVLSGANLLLKSTDVLNAKKLFGKSKVLLCQLETDEKAVLFALNHFKGVSILNASPAHRKLSSELIRAPTILCCNRLEAAQLTNRRQIVTLQDAKAAATRLIKMGAKSVIITMSDMGAVYLSSSEPDLCTQCPAALALHLTDTSGASDAFLGSLAYHIAIYPNLIRESHITAANICAAYAVSHRGTQPSFPGPNLFQERLCQFDPLYYIIGNDTGQITRVDPVTAAKAALGKVQTIMAAPAIMATSETNVARTSKPATRIAIAPRTTQEAMMEPEYCFCPEESEECVVPKATQMTSSEAEPQAPDYCFCPSVPEPKPKALPATKPQTLPEAVSATMSEAEPDEGPVSMVPSEALTALEIEVTPEAEPEAAPEAEPEAAPEAEPEPEAEPVPMAAPDEDADDLKRRSKSELSGEDEEDKKLTKTRWFTKCLVCCRKKLRPSETPDSKSNWAKKLMRCGRKSSKSAPIPLETSDVSQPVPRKSHLDKDTYSSDEEGKKCTKSTLISKCLGCFRKKPKSEETPTPLKTRDKIKTWAKKCMRCGRKEYHSSGEEGEQRKKTFWDKKCLACLRKKPKSVSTRDTKTTWTKKFLRCGRKGSKSAPIPAKKSESGSYFCKRLFKKKKSRKAGHLTDDEYGTYVPSPNANKPLIFCKRKAKEPKPLKPCDSGSDLSRPVSKKYISRKKYYSSDEEDKKPTRTSRTSRTTWTKKCIKCGRKSSKSAPRKTPETLKPSHSESDVPRKEKLRKVYHSSEDEGERPFTSSTANKPMVLGSTEPKAQKPLKICDSGSDLSEPVYRKKISPRKYYSSEDEDKDKDKDKDKGKDKDKDKDKERGPMKYMVCCRRKPKLSQTSPTTRDSKTSSAKKCLRCGRKGSKSAPGAIPQKTYDSESDVPTKRRPRKVYHSSDDEGEGQATSRTANIPMMLGSTDAKEPKPLKTCDSGSDEPRKDRLRKVYHSSDDEGERPFTSSTANKPMVLGSTEPKTKEPKPLKTCDSGSDFSEPVYRKKISPRKYYSSDDEDKDIDKDKGKDKDKDKDKDKERGPMKYMVCCRRKPKLSQTSPTTRDSKTSSAKKCLRCGRKGSKSAPGAIPQKTYDSESDVPTKRRPRKVYHSSDDEGERQVTSHTANKPMMLGSTEPKTKEPKPLKTCDSGSDTPGPASRRKIKGDSTLEEDEEGTVYSKPERRRYCPNCDSCNRMRASGKVQGNVRPCDQRWGRGRYENYHS
ncbi:ankyrin repeat domain-containing protein 12-like isoform X4 [Drosophila hydei]|uniref:Ribokinase n=1 Tax=Drosophila hydei TaxID=7224 RepID=A0A6J2SRB5_DROHY|nr:ankyrin repeat domain-containing protein 12-like isoform X4 [Drosophila hydei]